MITRIVTHHMPHVDEIVALWLLSRFGEKKFPGVSDATVEYIDPGRALPDGRDADEWEAEGALLVGVGGGRFDEHPEPGEKRELGECAATLVAHALDVAGLPELAKILKYTANNDTKGSSGPLDIVDLTGAMFKVRSHDEVLAWAHEALDAKYAQQVEFFGEAREQFEATHKVHVVEQTHYRPLRVVSMHADHESAAAYARLAESPDILVIGRGNGYLAILARQSMKLDLSGLVVRIRFAECKKAGTELPEPHQRMADEGSLSEIPEWYLQNGCWILNGSLRSKSETIPKTRLSVEEVVEIIKDEFGIRV